MPVSPLAITFPPDLPVSGKRDEIAAAIAQHPVVIVCGETGSGKTTQLPKIALALGRGRLNAAPGTRGRLIGHTQPRRIAATSVARRIAQELGTPLGEVVGYKVRFQDRMAPEASVKLMTDGILLAETQSDPLLSAYDTLIIDEAHERSLNIDFLLGYLRTILPRRPDLKLVVTSATIDADRFARHFASDRGPAPVIQVSGRLYPVEQRWRPFEESRDYGLNHAIADAVDELWAGGRAGDILVFLPGEREIREAAEHLRGHLAHQPALRGTEVLPLFARLSQAEQDRVFEPHAGRRIVLATNVAETSLTVPGIRYVIDSGLARVKRYSLRSKVEQLLVEPISQAAADQRAGRCGRVADGVCIRLYEQADFAGRPRFSDPEILRSSLAGVILQMKALHLGEVGDFAFLDPPSGRAIADGQQLLHELGAVDETGELTPIGRDLTRLPLDPRLGRMLIEARQRGALAETLVVAAALSVADVRDRPLAAQAQADQAHAQFDDDKSEFSGLLRLWQWLERSRGGHGTDHRLSHRQYEALLRQHFISPRRVREWRDIHSQLLTTVTQQRWSLNAEPAGYDALHQSLLAGLMGHVGWRASDDEAYLGARGIRFVPHPGAHLKRRPGRWVVCAELVETTRLFGRVIAAIEPTWLEHLGGHLLKRQLLEPHWEKKAGEVMALERATLYGLVVYNGRRVRYDRADPATARTLFIREALVAALTQDSWSASYPFLAANRRLIRELQEIEHKTRRQNVLVDDELIFAFYDRLLPAEVTGGGSFERWWKAASPEQRARLALTREELMRHEAAGVSTAAFPRTVRLGGVDCAATYRHDPGDPRDGVTLTLPLFALNQAPMERGDWLVPGLLPEKVQALLKSLPQKPRARLVPLAQTAAEISASLVDPAVYAQGDLIDALLARVRERTGLAVQRSDFKPEMVPPHLHMNHRVVDEHGRQLAQGRNLAALKQELGAQARGAFQALARLRTPGEVVENSLSTAKSPYPSAPAATKNEALQAPGEGAAAARAATPPEAAAPRAPALAPGEQLRHVRWDFGELPELMEIRKGGQTLVGFPALIDEGDAVRIEVFDEPDQAATRHRAGLRRLFALQLRDALKYLEKNIPDLQTMAMAYLHVGRGKDGGGGSSVEALRAQIVELALDRAFLGEPLPQDAAGFEQRLAEGRGRLTLIAGEVARLAGAVLAEHAAVARKLREQRAHPKALEDMAQQLARLVTPRFLLDTPWAVLHHLPRYLRAMAMRLDKLRSDPERDAARMAEIAPLEQRCWRRLAQQRGVPDARLQDYRWLLEELRVSLFAQELRTPQPVSVKRLEKVWAQLDA